MSYVKFIFTTDQHEILLARLSVDFGFDSFSEEDSKLEAWIREDDMSDEMVAKIDEELSELFSDVSIEIVEDQNWNAKWEEQYEPVIVRDFCSVRASFHAPIKTTQYDLVIDPKMSFGTGHHETTYMMIDAMSEVDFNGKEVLDLGCGTGVLGILAAKQGAASVRLCDTDPLCLANSIENCVANGLQLPVKLGSIDVYDGKTHDVILANINRNALMELMRQMAGSLNQGGLLLLSGILEQDMLSIRKAAQDHGLSYVSKSSRGEWRCMSFAR